MSQLPVETVIADIKTALRHNSGAVLQAPPGAGKTTCVPLALLEETWLQGRRIVMLEPRRLAARAAAHRMATLLRETVGQTVGYRVRMDSRVGPATRIEVVTEGVLTRMLQSDPGLAASGLVIFDEFHERHLDSDLGLALCLDIQGVLNESLRVLVMSATLEVEPVAALLGDVPVIRCEGRVFPVETRYLGRRQNMPLEKDIAAAVARSAAAEKESILVFLPGAAEIRRVADLLRRTPPCKNWLVAPLFGNLTRAEQDMAIRPAAAGRPKIVLATNIAETSLTIEGIRAVVDSGLMRAPQFDVRSGMTRLETLTVSRASAAQRCGRAGRTGPGVCYRLWSAEFHNTLKEKNRPEILEADLIALVLELSVWGVHDRLGLAWLDRPPGAAFAKARQLLKRLGALDESGTVTRSGRRMASLPLHPRLACMVMDGQAAGMGVLACELAALISERDFIRFAPGERDADLRLRIDILQDVKRNRTDLSGMDIDRAACRRILKAADDLRRRLKIGAQKNAAGDIGRLLARAYPDRIGRRRPGSHSRYLLTSGRGAYFYRREPLAAEAYLVAAELDGDRREAGIFLAAGIDARCLKEQFGSRIRTTESVEWDPDRQGVVALKQQKLDALTLSAEPLKTPDPQKVLAALLTGIRRLGIGCLPWSKALQRWQARVLFIGRLGAGGSDWPDVSDQRLSESLEQWLGPYLNGINRLKDIGRAGFQSALQASLNWKQRQMLEQLAPTHITVPSGSRRPLDYSGETPVLAVRIQEMFGLKETPVIAGGRQPLLLHLLSPAGRPAQITRDLTGFWKTGYPEVKKELKGRYPKHHWPDDPLNATPTARVRRNNADIR